MKNSTECVRDFYFKLQKSMHLMGGNSGYDNNICEYNVIFFCVYTNKIVMNRRRREER